MELDAQALHSRAMQDFEAAAIIWNSHPRQAAILLTSAVENAVRAACRSDGWDAVHEMPIAKCHEVLADELFGMSSRKDVANILRNGERLRSGIEVLDLEIGFEVDMRRASAFLGDVEDHIELVPTASARHP